MSNTNLLALQGVDEHVSNLVVSVGMEQNYIADLVLPKIPTRSANVKYRKMTNEFKLTSGLADTLRPSGAMPNTADLTFSTDTATLNPHMFGANIDIEDIAAAEAAGDGGGAMYRAALLSSAKNRVLIRKEIEAAAVVFGASNYGSNTVSTIDWGATGVRKTVMEAINLVEGDCGFRPNRLILGAQAGVELLNNADLMGRFITGGSADGVPLMQQAAAFLGLNDILIGSATTQTLAAAGAAGTDTRIWTTDSAALIYAPPAVSPFSPSFGYLFQGQYAWGGEEFAQPIDTNKLIEYWGYGQHFAYKFSFLAGYLWTDVTDT